MFNKKQLESINEQLKELIEVQKEQVPTSRKLIKVVEEHDGILQYATGVSSCYPVLEINGVGLEIDYREEELYNREKMVKVLIINSNACTEIKYTREKNLTSEEKKCYQKHDFVIVNNF